MGLSLCVGKYIDVGIFFAKAGGDCTPPAYKDITLLIIDAAKIRFLFVLMVINSIKNGQKVNSDAFMVVISHFFGN